jgi:hypothetical protein
MLGTNAFIEKEGNILINGLLKILQIFLARLSQLLDVRKFNVKQQNIGGQNSG